MNEYRFDVSKFTIADARAVWQAAKTNDVYALLNVANHYIRINLFACPYTEVPIIVKCFYEELLSPSIGSEVETDKIDQLIQRALEDKRQ